MEVRFEACLCMGIGWLHLGPLLPAPYASPLRSGFQHFHSRLETIAMKGLLMALLAERYDPATREAGLALIKQGIMKNLKSAAVWNIQFQYYRNERQYVEAAKALSQAITRSVDQEPLLRDLATLQAQAGLRDAHLETRRKLLMHRSNLRSNWMGYAVAAHLAGSLSQAISVIRSYRSTQEAEKEKEQKEQHDARGKIKNRPPAKSANKQLQETAKQAFETSELALYEATILEESGQLQEALDVLASRESEICDLMSLHQMRANLYEKLKQPEKALAEYEYLLNVNPHNYNFHYGVLRNKGIAYKVGEPIEDQKQYEALKEHFAQLEVKYPKSSAVKRLQLDFLNQTDFPAKAKAYVVPLLRSGVPSLFKDMRPLYAQQDGWKGRVLDQIVEGCLAELDAAGRLTESEEKNSESPSTILWVLTYLAHSADYRAQWSKALDYVNRAIAHTPTMLDLYMVRAGIYKHAGDMFTALKEMNKAREMDLADRFLNTKCTRYAFQAGYPELAERIISLFITEQNLRTTLYDLQVNWYFTQRGLCYKNKKDIGRALKALLAVDDFFESYFEDQIDYHSYTMRKGTMRQYCNILKWGAQLKQHKFYVRAITAAVEVFLSLYAEQQAAIASQRRAAAAAVGLSVEAIGGETGEGTPSFPSDDKKAEFEAKLAAIIAEDNAKNAAADAAKTKENEDANADFEAKRTGVKLNEKTQRGDLLTALHTPEVDPVGTKIVRCADPLKLASRYVHALIDLPGSSATSQLLAFEYFLAKGKLILALRALKQAKLAIEASEPAPYLETPPPNEFVAAQKPKAVESYPAYPSWFELSASAGVQRSHELVYSLFAASIHECQMRLALRINQIWSSQEEPARAVLEAEFALGENGALPARTMEDVQKRNAQYFATAGAKSLAARVACARVAMAIAKAQAQPVYPGFIQTDRTQGYSIEAVDYLTVEAKTLDTVSDASRSTARQVLAALHDIENSAKNLGGPECKIAGEVAARAAAAREALCKAATDKFPFDLAFMPAEKVSEIQAATQIDVAVAPTSE